MDVNKIYLGDCLEVMKDIKDKSVDMILCDLPYGTTACKWDKPISFELLWEQYDRIIKENGAILLFGAEPFTSHLIQSNLKYFKYNWIWIKDRTTNFLNVRKQPLRKTEFISVFYKKQSTYNPQLELKSVEKIRKSRTAGYQTPIYGKMDKELKRSIPDDMTYPTEILYFKSCTSTNKKSKHPTEKPVDLLEYLIKTYTNENELVLDNCMGSGSTAVACMNTNRNFIGIEKDKEFYEMANRRIGAYY